VSVIKPHIKIWAALGLLVVAVFGVAATAILGQSPGIIDDRPSNEEIERQARERGINETLNIPDAAPLDPDPRVYEHGPFVLVPAGWAGPTPDVRPVDDPLPSAPASTGEAETSKSPLWRLPRNLPEGYSLVRAASPQLNGQVEMEFQDAKGIGYIEVIIAKPQVRPIVITTWGIGEGQVFERTEIDGMPAIIRLGSAGMSIHAFDETEGTLLFVQGGPELAVESAVEIVEGLRQ
jgi:hypothetical protein